MAGPSGAQSWNDYPTSTSIYLRHEDEVSGRDNAHAFTAGFRMTG